MSEDKTHYESLHELRQAMVNLWYAALYEVGNNLISAGHVLTDAAIDASASEEPGLINDACKALENLSNYKPDITVSTTSVDEFSEQVERAVRDITALK